MNREETIRVLKILKEQYPKYYADKNRDAHESMIKAMNMEFRNHHFDVVKAAAFEWIGKNPRLHPKMTELRQSMYDVLGSGKQINGKWYTHDGHTLEEAHANIDRILEKMERNKRNV